MTGWNVLNNFLNSLPFTAAVLFTIMLFVAALIFVIGFSGHGLDFVKYGLSAKPVFNELLEKLATKEDISRLEYDITGIKTEITGMKTEINGMKTEITGMKTEINGIKTEINGMKTEINGIKTDITGMKTEIADIKVNHFGHLKNYLGVLNGILLDKGIIDNESRARLDNELRGM